MNPSATQRMLTQLWFTTIAVLGIAVLYLAKVLPLPLGFAILFAFLLAPIVAFLERLRLPRPIAALCVILAFAALLLVATLTLFTQFVAIANDLPTYGGNIAQRMQALHSPSNSAYSRAQCEIQKISEELGIANSTGSIPPPGEADANPVGATLDHPMHVREVGRPIGRLDQLDGSDDLISTMLAQVLDQAGFHATSLPVQRIDETVSTVTEQKPDIVFPSGMPSVAMARAPHFPQPALRQSSTENRHGNLALQRRSGQGRADDQPHRGSPHLHVPGRCDS